MSEVLENTIEGTDGCHTATEKHEEMPETEAWQQLPDESSKAYHAFRLYCYAGSSRSINKIAEALGKDSGGFGRYSSYEKQLEKWSKKYEWRNRAHAWDFYVEELIQRRYLEDVFAMVDRHAEQARELQEKAFAQLMSLDVSNLRPSELIRLFNVAVKVEKDSISAKSKFVHLGHKDYPFVEKSALGTQQ